MIDFVSTNPSAEPQTVACARLLAAVIAQAIDDATDKNISETEQYLAVHWLFSPDSTFSSYAAIIGLDAGAFRTALLSPPSDNEPRKSKFGPIQRRMFKLSYLNYTKRRDVEKQVLAEMLSKQLQEIRMSESKNA